MSSIASLALDEYRYQILLCRRLQSHTGTRSILSGTVQGTRRLLTAIIVGREFAEEPVISCLIVEIEVLASNLSGLWERKDSRPPWPINVSSSRLTWRPQKVSSS